MRQQNGAGLEEEAAACISSHHKALALIGKRLQLELLREAPLNYAWVGWLWETALHWLFGLGSRWVFREAYNRTKANVQQFVARRKEQAVTKMAEVIRQPQSTATQKQFAALTLGLATGEPFHLDRHPLPAAVTWLDRHER